MREKSNQVSINGSIENVEVTRVKIRSLLPVTVLCDIPLQVRGQVVRTDVRVRVCVCVCVLCMCVAWRQTAGCHTRYPMQSESPTDRQIIMHSHMPQNVRAYTHTHTHYSTYVVFLFPFSVSRPSLTPRPQPSTSSYRPTVSASLLNMWVIEFMTQAATRQHFSAPQMCWTPLRAGLIVGHVVWSLGRSLWSKQSCLTGSLYAN